jgi:hypothetical protein
VKKRARHKEDSTLFKTIHHDTNAPNAAAPTSKMINERGVDAEQQPENAEEEQPEESRLIN